MYNPKTAQFFQAYEFLRTTQEISLSCITLGTKQIEALLGSARKNQLRRKSSGDHSVGTDALAWWEPMARCVAIDIARSAGSN